MIMYDSIRGESAPSEHVYIDQNFPANVLSKPYSSSDCLLKEIHQRRDSSDEVSLQ